MTTRHSKKRKYFRKCGFCGSRHEQSEMVRTDHSPNGWICRECLEGDEEPDLDELVTMVELAPCPFCGGSDIGINRRAKHYRGFPEVNWDNAQDRRALVNLGWTCLEPLDSECKNCPAGDLCRGALEEL